MSTVVGSERCPVFGVAPSTGFQRRKCRCDVCSAWRREYDSPQATAARKAERERRKRAGEWPAQCPVHGVSVATAYNLRGCRCDVCFAAKSVKGRQSYQAHRDKRLLWQRENRATVNENNRRYKQRHRERVLAKAREYARRKYISDPDESRARSRRWRDDNLEAARDRAREWHRNNRERGREYARQWAQENPDRVRANNRRRRAREKGAPGTHTDVQLQARIEYYGGLCYLCGVPYQEIDHVIALARGGSDWPANLRPICRPCNTSKNARPLSEVLR